MINEIQTRRFASIFLFLFLSYNTYSQLVTCSVNAGSNGTWCFGDTIYLDGNAAGLIQPGSIQWSQTSGIPVTIINPNSLKAKIAPTAAGVYSFKLAAMCSQGLAEQEVVHTILDGATPNAGMFQTIDCYKGGGIPLTGFNLPPTNWTASWSSQDGSVVNDVFFPDSTLNTTCYPSPSYYTLKYTFSNDYGCIKTNNKTIRINNYIPDSFNITIEGGCGSNYVAKAICPGAALGTWSIVSPTPAPGVSFSDPNSNVTKILGITDNQAYTIRYTITSPVCGSVFAEATFTALVSEDKITSCPSKTYYFCTPPDSLHLEGCKPNPGNNEHAFWRVLGYYEAFYVNTIYPTYNAANISLQYNEDSTAVTITGLDYGNLQLEYVITDGKCESVTTFKVIILGELSLHEEYKFSNYCGTFTQSGNVCQVIPGNHNVFVFNEPTLANANSLWGGGQLVPVGPTTWLPLVSPPGGDTVSLHFKTFTAQYVSCFGTTFYLPVNIPNGTYIFHGEYNIYGINNDYYDLCGKPDYNITFEISSPPIPSNAGTDQFVCATSTVLAGNAVRNANWYFLSKFPVNAATPVLQGDSTALLTVNNMTPDAEYKFVYRSWGGAYCESSYDTVIVRTAATPPMPPNAGADGIGCFGSEISLAATPNPFQPGTIGVWSLLNQIPGGVAPQIESPQSPTTSVQSTLANTAYTFRYSVQNGCGTAFDDVTITTGSTEGPNPPNAGANQCLVAGTTTANLSATPATPISATGIWTAVPGNPPAATISSPNNPNTTITGLSNGTYRFVWTVSKAPCGSLSDTLLITVGAGALAEIVEDKIEICNQPLPATIPLQANIIGNGVGTWSIITGIPGAIIANANAANTSVSGLLPGAYKFRWTVDNGACGNSTDEVSVLIGDTPPIVHIGNDTVLCASSNGILQLNGTSGGNIPGLWSVVNLSPGVPSAGATFVQNTAPNQNNAVVQLNPGKTRLRWSLLPAAPCADIPSVDDILVEYVPAALVQADTMKLCSATAFNLAGSNPGSLANGTWSQTEGPMLPGFPLEQPNSNPLVITLPPGAGIFKFKYTISNANCPTTSDSLTVINSPLPPFPVAGIDDTICVKDEILLSGTIPPADYTATWTMKSGPTPSWQAQYSPNAHAPQATFKPVFAGNYLFEYSITNGGCTLSDIVFKSVTISTINAGPDKTICDETTATLGVAGSGLNWTAVEGNPANATIDPTSGQITNMTNPGTYTFKLSDGSGCYDLARVLRIQAFTITDQPTGDTVCVGGLATLNLTGSATQGTLQYQWQSSSAESGPFSNISGATSQSFSPLTTIPGANFFRVLLKNTANTCKDTSVVATFQVLPDPAIATQPGNESVCEGTSISLTSSATGGVAPITYQWQSSNTVSGPWNDVIGANNTSLSPVVQPGVQYFRLLVNAAANGCNTATSNPATVTVDAQVAINAVPKDTMECVGGNLTLNCSASPSNAVFQWQSSTAPTGPFVDTGNNQSSFMPASTFPGTNYYRILVNSPNNLCHDTSAVAAVAIVTDQTITTQPMPANECIGVPIVLNGAAIGGIQPLFYQWQISNGPIGPWQNIAGQTSNSLAINTNISDTAYYRLQVSSAGSGCLDIQSTPALVQVGPSVAISQQPQNVTECYGGQETLTIAVAGSSNPVIQWQISTNGGISWTNIPGATSNSYTPPSVQNNWSGQFRAIISDPNSPCGIDTSSTALVVVNTPFSIMDTVEVCNFSDGIGSTNVNFSNLILVGDPGASWQSIDGANPTGAWNNKDFTGTSPGTYRFVATTTNAFAPCLNVQDTVIVRVNLCCPLVCTSPPINPLCNALTSGAFQLNNLLCSGAQPGAWSIVDGPGISTPMLLTDNQFHPAGQSSGTYTLQYNLSQFPASCPGSSEQIIQIVQTPNAGMAQTTGVVCQGQDSVLNLATLLTGQDSWGAWTTQNTLGSNFSQQTGTLKINGLGAGTYHFDYTVAATGCPDDKEAVTINILPLPFVDAGLDLALTCDEPLALIGNVNNTPSNSVSISWISETGEIANSLNKAQIEVDSPGLYIVQTIDTQTGCANTDSVQIQIGESFIAGVSTDAKPPVCFGDENATVDVLDVLGGTAPFEFTLSNTQFTASNGNGHFNGLQAGMYQLSVADANGCKSTTEIQINDAVPFQVSLLKDTVIGCGDSMRLELITNLAPTSIKWVKWYTFGVLTDTALVFSKTVFPTQTSNYTIKIQDQNGCIAERQAKVEVNNNADFYAPNVFKPDESGKNDQFRLFFSEKIDHVFTFQIFDRWGNNLYRKDDFAPNDPSVGWDGWYDGVLMNPAVFVWYAEIQACYGAKAIIKGDVTLVR